MGLEEKDIDTIKLKYTDCGDKRYQTARIVSFSTNSEIQQIESNFISGFYISQLLLLPFFDIYSQVVVRLLATAILILSILYQWVLTKIIQNVASEQKNFAVTFEMLYNMIAQFYTNYFFFTKADMQLVIIPALLLSIFTFFTLIFFFRKSPNLQGSANDILQFNFAIKEFPHKVQAENKALLKRLEMYKLMANA